MRCRGLGARLALLLLASACVVSPVRAEQIPSLFSRSVPQGFEDLAAKRHLEVTVVFGRAQIGKVGASVDLQSITFDEPAAVVALLPNVVERGRIVAALSGPLPLNAKLVCGEQPRAGCGQFVPDVAGVIYDSANEELRLLVNPIFQARTASLERLQPRGNEPALLSKVNLNVSGQSGSNEPFYSMDLTTIAGVGSSHIRAQTLVRNQQSDIDQLYARHVNDGVEQVAGFFNSSASSFLPPERLLGAQFGTTLDDLPVDASAYDVPLSVALAAPATIDVFVGDRLIASARYQAGEARIDTSSFPPGAYLVRLRIVEGSQERIEERFFARESAFPPLGAPQTSVAFGTRYPGAGFNGAGSGRNIPALQVSHRRRLSNYLGLGGSLYGRERAFAAEGTLGIRSGNTQWSGSILGSNASERAYATSVRVQTGSWRLIGDTRRMLTSNALGLFDDRRFLAVSESFWQTSLSASRTFGQAQFQAIALWRRGATSRESWTVQPFLDLPINVVGQRLRLRLSAGFGPDRSTVRAEIEVPTGSPNVAARGGSSWLRERERTRVNPIYEAELLDQRRFAPETELQTSVKWRQDERESLASGANLRTGKGSAFVTLQSDLDNDRKAYFGNAQSGFAWTREGFAFTPAGSGDAAIMYVNKSPSNTGPADALLSNARVGTLQPQERRAQPVPAFRRFDVGMLPSRGAALEGGSSKAAILFPGTVATVKTELVQVTAVFGQVVEPDGAPIGNGLLTGLRSYGGSDGDGFFQIDITGVEYLSLRRPDGSTCTLKLAPPPDVVAVYDAGKVVCQ